MNILLTGATGYIGEKLANALSERGANRLRLLVRNPAKLVEPLRDSAEVFTGDTLRPDTLAPALNDVDVAYYLIHSMGAGKQFRELDRRSAENFRKACTAAGVRRQVYLGGLGDKETASAHLLSRIETGEVLSARPEQIQTLWFRAGIIIGSGSASFEIIRHLVRKLPVMITPRWVQTKTQPIGVDDVVRYLIQAKDLEVDSDLQIDIGSEIMTFREILLRAAKAMGLKRWLIPVPLLTPRLSSYWLVLVTPVPFRVARELIDGLKSETVSRNRNALTHFPDITPLPYEQTIKKAVAE